MWPEGMGGGLAASTASYLLAFSLINIFDPTIGNVVPVLDSYWLMIHTSIIVSSYSFFFLGAKCGLISILLTIFKRSSPEKINYMLSSLRNINEILITVGLFMLTIGTFLGGIWASESWGRYWGWDPKEAWALISVLVYAIILHLRFIPFLKGKLTFSVFSVFALYSILMTYFGVNHLLSGLHSYGAGDKVPIPNSVWISIVILVILSIIAYSVNQKRNKYLINKV